MGRQANIVFAVVAGLVVALGVAAWIVSAVREPTQLEPGSPEATVQAFLRAVTDDDDDALIRLLDPELGCSAPLDKSYDPGGFSWALISSKPTGDSATVEIEITQYGDGPLDSWSHRQVFDLVRFDNDWLVTGSPWPYLGCE